MQRTAPALAVVAVAVLAAAGASPAVAQTANNSSTPTQATATPSATVSPTPTPTRTPTQSPTPTPTPASTGSGGADGGDGYTIHELKRGGEQPSAAPPSVRYLGSSGAVAIRYTPANPLKNDRKYLKPETTLHTDDIQLYSTRFGQTIEPEDYTLHVVFWQQERRTVETANGSRTILVAANQTERTYSVTLGTGYAVANLTLPSHFDQRWRATMWLSKDGRTLDGVRWVLGHRSDPGGQSIDIATKTDAWTFAAKNVAGPGGIGIVVGLLLSRMTLRRTGRPPDMGAELWGLMAVIGIPLLITTAYFQGAVILSHAAWVMGALFTVVGYCGGFLFANPVRRIGFERQEIMGAKSLPGFGVGDEAATDPDAGGPERGDPLADGGAVTADADHEFIAADQYVEELYRDLPEVRLVRTDDGFKPVTKGVRPFFARLFTANERVDLSSFRTRVRVHDGRLDEIIHVDPDSEEAVTHVPARVRRALPWDELPRDEETGDVVAGWREQLTAGLMTALVVAGPPAGGWYVLDSLLGIPAVGALAGVVVTCVLAYTAEPAFIDFEEAPIHDVPARNAVTFLQRRHKEAKDIRDAREAEYREKAKTAREAREEREHEKKTVTDEVLATLGGIEELHGDRTNGDDDDGDASPAARTNGHGGDDDGDE